MSPKKGGEGRAGKESAGKEVGRERNGPGCWTERDRNWRSVSEVLQSLGGHGNPISLDYHSMAFAPQVRLAAELREFEFVRVRVDTFASPLTDSWFPTGDGENGFGVNKLRGNRCGEMSATPEPNIVIRESIIR